MTLTFSDYFPLGFRRSATSHFLFLYSEHFDLTYHLLTLRELFRVVREARIFPIMELGSVPSRHLDAALAILDAEGYEVAIERVAYEFQKGGNEMLRLRPPTPM